MPNVRKAKDVESGLVGKGFREARETKHKFFIYYTVDNLKTGVRTMTSFGSKEIPNPLLGQMARQCHVDRKQFLDLVDCPLSREEYQQLLEDGGLI